MATDLIILSFEFDCVSNEVLEVLKPSDLTTVVKVDQEWKLEIISVRPGFAYMACLVPKCKIIESDKLKHIVLNNVFSMAISLAKKDSQLKSRAEALGQAIEYGKVSMRILENTSTSVKLALNLI